MYAAVSCSNKLFQGKIRKHGNLCLHNVHLMFWILHPAEQVPTKTSHSASLLECFNLRVVH